MAIYFFIAMDALAAKRAFVVGIGDYPHVTKLHGPQQDAKNIRQLLIDDLGFAKNEIKLLLDEDASRKGILNGLEQWLVNNSSANDELLFYYSGHGFQSPDKSGDEADKLDEAIAPYDAKIVDGEVVNMITDDEFQQIFAKLDDRSVTMIIDSCHSGTLTRGLFSTNSAQHEKTIAPLIDSNIALKQSAEKSIIKAHREEVAFIEETQNRVVWTAVSAWQKALVDFETKDGSVFTNYFIKGIKSKLADVNQDGVVSRSELLSYIRRESDAFCRRNKNSCSAGLTPTLEVAKDLLIEAVIDTSNKPSEQDEISNTEFISSSVVSATHVNQSQDAAIDSKLDRPAFNLSVFPNTQIFYQGQSVTFEVQIPADGYLLLFDVDQQDNVSLLFPFSDDEKGNRGKVNQGDVLSLASIAKEPAGHGKIVAIHSKDDIFGEVQPTHSKDLILDNPKEFIREVSVALNRVWVNDSTNRSVDWKSRELKYQITNN